MSNKEKGFVVMLMDSNLNTIRRFFWFVLFQIYIFLLGVISGVGMSGEFSFFYVFTPICFLPLIFNFSFVECIRIINSKGGTKIDKISSNEERLTFNDVQNRMAAWAEHNTPPMSKDEVICGIVGELGELAQARRYSKQSRFGGNPCLSDEDDCIGDIVLFVARYCNESDFDFGECVRGALEEVEQRRYYAK